MKKSESAYMVNDKTRAIIAKYLAEALNASLREGIVEGIKTIEVHPKEIRNIREFSRCYDAFDWYSAPKIYETLYDLNRRALIGRYGEKDGKKMAGKKRKMPDVDIQIDEKSRRVWLTNLYVVVNCFIYQCSEAPNYTTMDDGQGGVKYIPCPALEFLRGWKARMGEVLAEYVVEEVRGLMLKRKFWDEF